MYGAPAESWTRSLPSLRDPEDVITGLCVTSADGLTFQGDYPGRAGRVLVMRRSHHREVGNGIQPEGRTRVLLSCTGCGVAVLSCRELRKCIDGGG